MKRIVHYLAHPYRDNPTSSIWWAHVNANKLRAKGLLVHSPIEATHYRHEWIMSARKDEKDDLVKEKSSNVLPPHPYYTMSLSLVELERYYRSVLDKFYPIGDYVQEDLELIEGWMHHDGGMFNVECCNHTPICDRAKETCPNCHKILNKTAKY